MIEISTNLINAQTVTNTKRCLLLFNYNTYYKGRVLWILRFINRGEGPILCKMIHGIYWQTSMTQDKCCRGVSVRCVGIFAPLLSMSDFSDLKDIFSHFSYSYTVHILLNKRKTSYWLHSRNVILVSLLWCIHV